MKEPICRLRKKDREQGAFLSKHRNGPNDPSGRPTVPSSGPEQSGQKKSARKRVTWERISSSIKSDARRAEETLPGFAHGPVSGLSTEPASGSGFAFAPVPENALLNPEENMVVSTGYSTASVSSGERSIRVRPVFAIFFALVLLWDIFPVLPAFDSASYMPLLWLMKARLALDGAFLAVGIFLMWLCFPPSKKKKNDPYAPGMSDVFSQEQRAAYACESFPVVQEIGRAHV